MNASKTLAAAGALASAFTLQALPAAAQTPPAVVPGNTLIVENNGAPSIAVRLNAPGTGVRGDFDFVMRYTSMANGDFTYNQNGIRGRGIDCQVLPFNRAVNDYGVTVGSIGAFFDIAEGSSFDRNIGSAYEIIDQNLIRQYIGHIGTAHHRTNADIRMVYETCKNDYLDSTPN